MLLLESLWIKTSHICCRLYSFAPLVIDIMWGCLLMYITIAHTRAKVAWLCLTKNFADLTSYIANWGFAIHVVLHFVSVKCHLITLLVYHCRNYAQLKCEIASLHNDIRKYDALRADQEARMKKAFMRGYIGHFTIYNIYYYVTNYFSNFLLFWFFLEYQFGCEFLCLRLVFVITHCQVSVLWIWRLWVYLTSKLPAVPPLQLVVRKSTDLHLFYLFFLFNGIVNFCYW